MVRAAQILDWFSNEQKLQVWGRWGPDTSESVIISIMLKQDNLIFENTLTYAIIQLCSTRSSQWA